MNLNKQIVELIKAMNPSVDDINSLISDLMDYAKEIDVASILKAMPKTIKALRTRTNSAKAVSAVKSAASAAVKVVVSTGFTVSSVGAATKGTRAKAVNVSTPEQKLNVMVSNMRRYLFNINVNSTLAEETIDEHLKSLPVVAVVNYVKSKRRANWKYAPIQLK